MNVRTYPQAAVLRNSSAVVSMRGGSSMFSEPSLIGSTSGNDFTPWAKWGGSNQMPSEYNHYFSSAGVLSGGIDIISRIAMGRGVIPVNVTILDGDGNEQVDVINDPEITSWIRNNNITKYCYDSISDILKTGHCFTRFLCNGNRNYVNKIRRADPDICRLGKYSDRGRIENLYLSHQWDKASTFDNTIVKKVTLLDRESPLLDLYDENGNLKRLPAEFAVTGNYPLSGSKYYTSTAWWAGRMWAEIAIRVPEMKAIMFGNQITIKYYISIADAYWESRWQEWDTFSEKDQLAKRESVLQELDSFLSGNENAYKSLISGSYTVPGSDKAIPYITITPLDDKIKDGKLLPDSAAANSELLFTLMLNPALLGVDMPGDMYGGGKGGSNIREAFLAQILIREVERNMVLQPLLVVAEINGWLTRYPGMTFRFPNHYLTTLDTGKNAKVINA